MTTDAFTIKQVGTTGHEIRDPDGFTVAWAATEAWAALIAFLLNRVEAEGCTAGPENLAQSDTPPVGRILRGN
ncbi:MAG: hypothetical protein ABSG86_12020 [Thermoguttaceae bacterium]|jgi:hypothetical protein